jgi:hypothetical protein
MIPQAAKKKYYKIFLICEIREIRGKSFLIAASLRYKLLMQNY